MGALRLSFCLLLLSDSGHNVTNQLMLTLLPSLSTMIEYTPTPPNQFFLNLVTYCEVFDHISRKSSQCKDHRDRSSHARHLPGTDRTEANGTVTTEISVFTYA